jgi:orotidine-5'-phosphate decarboxylase
VPERPTESPGFGERLAQCVEARASQLVLGLDPHPERLWPAALAAAPAEGAPAARAAAAISTHCGALIDAAGGSCVAVKLQLACFERLGAPGWEAMATVAARAREAGLLVIADGKRGDIDISAAAYAEALMGGTQTPFGPVPGLAADAATVNPLLGRDALAPFIDVAGRAGAGLFVLVRTSNPGAADLEDLRTSDGLALWEHIAALVADAGASGAPDASPAGLSHVGAVVGATVPEHLVRMRELMPRSVFLLPGIGAQGGRVEDLAPAFAPGPAGGLITASRAIAEAHLSEGAGEPATAAHEAAERLRARAWTLSQG